MCDVTELGNDSQLLEADVDANPRIVAEPVEVGLLKTEAYFRKDYESPPCNEEFVVWRHWFGHLFVVCDVRCRLQGVRVMEIFQECVCRRLRMET